MTATVIVFYEFIVTMTNQLLLSLYLNCSNEAEFLQGINAFSFNKTINQSSYNITIIVYSFIYCVFRDLEGCGFKKRLPMIKTKLHLK